ncbi:hypothetical protein [uncultured Streptomyces sp.]|uniref:hypothetical protein n=1 Tax=uncultured Streptomyces sp. TaxID=174707 RepID=UPI00261DBA54|nr:hypothetical protein [uncultured Streptomyces sp.]
MTPGTPLDDADALDRIVASLAEHDVHVVAVLPPSASDATLHIGGGGVHEPVSPLWHCCSREWTRSSPQVANIAATTPAADVLSLLSGPRG